MRKTPSRYATYAELREAAAKFLGTKRVVSLEEIAVVTGRFGRSLCRSSIYSTEMREMGFMPCYANELKLDGLSTSRGSARRPFFRVEDLVGYLKKLDEKGLIKLGDENNIKEQLYDEYKFLVSLLM